MMWKKLMPFLLACALLAGCNANEPVDIEPSSGELPSSEAAVSSLPEPPPSSEPDAGEFRIPDLALLNDIWEQASPEGYYERGQFSDRLTYYTCDRFEVFLQPDEKTILIRDKQNGEWQEANLGSNIGQGIVSMYQDFENPQILEVSFDGVSRYPDGVFRDFPRNVYYDVEKGEITSVEIFRNAYNASGTYGGSSWDKQHFLPEISGNAITLDFALSEEDSVNGYRRPTIELDYDVINWEETDYNIYYLRFPYVENNLSEEDITSIRQIEGVLEFTPEYFENAGFTGTVWTLRLGKDYGPFYSFQLDYGLPETYRSFTIEIGRTGRNR